MTDRDKFELLEFLLVKEEKVMKKADKLEKQLYELRKDLFAVRTEIRKLGVRQTPLNGYADTRLTGTQENRVETGNITVDEKERSKTFKFRLPRA